MDTNCSICNLMIEGDAKICPGCGESFCLMCSGNDNFCGTCIKEDFDNPEHSINEEDEF